MCTAVELSAADSKADLLGILEIYCRLQTRSMMHYIADLVSVCLPRLVDRHPQDGVAMGLECDHPEGA